jgi:uncharacterized protein
MKISLERLSASPLALSFEADSAWWVAALEPGPDLPRELPEALRFTLQAYRMGEDVYLEGGLEGVLDLECSRCLARYRHALREPFRLVLEPAGDGGPADPEAREALARYGVGLGDDLDTGWFRGHELDLGAFFKEVVALALPVKPLCREDCPGLCPRCGADLGSESCRCEQTRSESPFAVLASLRGGSTGGDD